MSHNQYDQSEKIVRLIHGIFGIHPTYRAFHASGALYRGKFQASDQAKTYTRALHLQGTEIPVTVRFSYGGGDPEAAPKQTVGMATKFYLPDGRVTDLIMLNAPTFPAKNVEDLVGLIECFDPATHKPDQEKLGAFLAAHPASAAALGLRKSLPSPVSFAETMYHAIHVFRFVNAEGKVTIGKYHWKPRAGERGQSIEELQKNPIDHLFEEIKERVAKQPVEFDLLLEIGLEGDPVDDPTVLWPVERERVLLGTIRLSAATSTEEIGDPIMLHDPTRVTDGIELTEDPIVHARRGAYDVSVADRTGGWHSCPFSKVAGA